MPAPANAFVMRDALVTVEGTSYANQCWVARLVPDAPIVSQRTLVPDGVIVDVDSAIWTFEITMAQINKAGGLSKVLRDAEPGTELDVVLVPADDATGSPRATFTVLSLPTPFGGTQGALADNEMVLPVVGSPVFDATTS